MSFSESKLPPYSEIPASKEKSAPSTQIAANRIAGSVQTCSIKDGQRDYLSIVCESPTSYYICLTVDPTPIYRIKFVSDSAGVSDIQVFPALDNTLPAVAAARLSTNPKSKSEPAALICTSEPYLPDALWRPLERASRLSTVEFNSSIPIIMVPGTAPKPNSFSWRINSLTEPFAELWWNGPLPLLPSAQFVHDQQRAQYVFTTVAWKKAETEQNLIEIRRGGGLEFELGVILELFAVSHLQKKPFI